MARFHEPTFLLQMPEIEEAIDQFTLEQQMDELIAREEYREWIEYNWIDDNPYCEPKEYLTDNVPDNEGGYEIFEPEEYIEATKYPYCWIV